VGDCAALDGVIGKKFGAVVDDSCKCQHDW
jgi:hypothetical protein